MKSNKSDYHYLVGKDKNQIIHELGQQFNYYQSEVWSYILKIEWFYKKTVLVILFQNDIVFEIKVKNCYGKFNT
jgi:hypothetical protein